ncbi:catalase-related domain-containing protein [Acinetobacter baumannii]
MQISKTTRQRSDCFDYFSQPRLYYKSLAPHEQKHVVDAYTFELSKVQKKAYLRERQVQQILANIANDADHNLVKVNFRY